MVEWQPSTTVEVRDGIAPKQRLRDWLRLASDKTYVATSLPLFKPRKANLTCLQTAVDTWLSMVSNMLGHLMEISYVYVSNHGMR